VNLAPAHGRRLAWLTVYAVAMGLLEASVVVYLRELYYPGGFRFPLVALPTRILVVEIVREAATIAMLGAVAVLAGEDALDRFFVFGFLFGGWDLVYYLGLLLSLGWPPSLLAWDILFLIPVLWLGPVVYPILISTLLVAGFFAHEILEALGRRVRLSRREWLAAVLGAGGVVLSFCWRAKDALAAEGPRDFPVALLATGLLVAVLAFLRAGARALRA
jgi:hypothetical protein